MRRPWIICLLLFAVTLGVYWPVRHHDFIYYDDPQFITENDEIKAGLTTHGFVYAFTQPVVGNWHPITTLSHMLDCQWFGVNPGAHHLMNAAIHAVNASLLFLLLNQLTGALWRSVFVAALFALHPLRVESVAWAAERKDVLCAFFGLLSLLAYARYARRSVRHPPSSLVPYFTSPTYWLMFLLFALGLMSKAMLVTWPALMLLLDCWPLGRIKYSAGVWSNWKRCIIEKIPLFVLSAAVCVITLRVQAAAGATQILGRVELGDRLSNAVMSYAGYISKTIWPAGLAVVYPHPAAPYAASSMWPEWLIGLATLVFVAFSIGAVKLMPRAPYLFVGWFWFLITLIPVIGFVQVGEQAMADRYTYIPSVGLAILIVWGLCELAAAIRWPPTMVAFVGLVVLGALGIRTVYQLRCWQNTIALFSHNVEVTPNNPSANFALGVGLEKAGRVAEAMEQYRAAVRLHPRYKKAYYNMGQLFRKEGDLPSSEVSFRAALDADPNDIPARLNLAGVLSDSGRTEASIAQYEEVLRRDADCVEALNNLAWILAVSPQDEVRDGGRAVDLAEKACRLTDNHIATLIGTLAAAYAEAGRFDDAISTAQKAHDMALSLGEAAVASKNLELLALYRQGKPYRENLAKSNPEESLPARNGN